MKTFTLTILFILLFTSSYAQQTCGNMYPEPSPDGNTLLFCSNRDGIYQIYQSNIDGSNIHRFTSNTFEEWGPKYSPDGSRVVFFSGPTGSSSEIFIINDDGTNQVQLTNNTRYDGNPSFSPDNDKIIFDGWDDTDYPEIFIMNIDGSGRAQITNEPGAYHQHVPQFHPSGNKIYYLQGFNADNHIMMMNTNGTDRVDITPANEFGYNESSFNFNPAGDRLVFATSEWGGYSGPIDIVSCAADGSDWQRLTNGPEGDRRSYFPSYNGAGNQIIYCNENTNPDWIFDIFNMATDGSSKEVVVTCNESGILDHYPGILNLSCVPNPVAEQAVIAFKSSDSRDIRISIFDNLGRPCVVNHCVADVGITIYRGNLEAGIYHFIISDKHQDTGSGSFIIR
jgi:Tol biopolymer transport system component